MARAGLLGLAAGMLALAGGLSPASALPSYARQTGQACSACHTSIPELTAYGRDFKIGGYTDKVDGAPMLPVAMMLLGGYTSSRKDQSAPPLPYSNKTNDILSLDQVSLFYAGQVAGDLGAFVQVTYDPNARAWGWDNADFRYANAGTLFGQDATLGVSFNNNPTVQDPWATSPAWGYPAFDSAAAPEFGLPGTLLQGGVEMQVVGITGYSMFDNGLYAEIGGYGGLSQSALNRLGAGGSGFDVSGLAPYARVAYSQDVGGGTLMLGAMAMAANLQPGYTGALGSDRYTDLGFDAQFDYSGGNYGLMFKARNIFEWQTLNATLAGGGSSNLKNQLDALDLSVTYYKPTWSLIGAFSNVSGSADAGLYSGSSVANSPDGRSVSFEANFSPWMNGGPGGFTSSNTKLGAKYTHFMKLNGGTSNFDGAGTNASDNDYLFVYAMVAF